MNNEVKKARTVINKVKQSLITKAKKNGIYENFGQKEIDILENQYQDFCYGNEEQKIIYHLIEEFTEWCWNYEG